MNVYPLQWDLGPIEITGYGIMLVVAFLMAGWLIARQLREAGLKEDYAADMVAAAVVGGIIGAKLWYVALTGDPNALLSRGGLVWYGGFIGGALAVILNSWRVKVPLRWTMQLAAPALAAGYALGRVGCFLVNDDYGRPTNLPWGVRFPEGLPPSTAENLKNLFGIPIPEGVDPTSVLAVHPTQLYEAAAMLVVFAVLWSLRKSGKPVGWLFGLYLVFAGVERFLVEILRAKDDRFLGPFTLAQLTSVIIVVIGMSLLFAWRRGPSPAPGAYLSTGKKQSVTKVSTAA
jgi:phosphatidylglycerol---prolipoprotein diacylglyceryl transferase